MPDLNPQLTPRPPASGHSASSSNPSLPSIVTKWVEVWSSQPLDPDAWVSLYAPRAKYTDHAFQLVRIGHETLRSHFHIWRHVNPDFFMEIDEKVPVTAEPLSDQRVRYSIRTHNKGTFVEDLPRRKASGKKFNFRGVVDLVVNGDGLIEEVEEWYCSNFDDSNGVGEYNTKADPPPESS